jgi:hypothetical protein
MPQVRPQEGCARDASQRRAYLCRARMPVPHRSRTLTRLCLSYQRSTSTMSYDGAARAADAAPKQSHPLQVNGGRRKKHNSADALDSSP